MSVLALLLALQTNTSMIRLSAAPEGANPMLIWEISTERAASLPRSNPQLAPPVSIEEASRLAETWMKAHNLDVERFEIQSIFYTRIRRTNPDVDFWYYQIALNTYRTPPRPGDQLARVVVLPDGTVVEPRVDAGAFPPAVAFNPQDAHMTPPRLLKKVQPQYTADAMNKKLQGSVFVAFTVLPDGTVSDVRIVRSLDPGGLDLAALTAVKQYRFEPGTKDGQPIPMVAQSVVTFTLK